MTPIPVPVRNDARSRAAVRAEVERRRQQMRFEQLRLDALKGASVVLGALFTVIGALSILTWI